MASIRGNGNHSVSVSGRVVFKKKAVSYEISTIAQNGLLTFRTNDKTTALLRSLVDGFDDVDQLLLILQHPVEFVVVTGSKVAHHVFVPVEEHNGHRVVKLVHRIELWNLIDVT